MASNVNYPKLANIPLWNLLEEFFLFRTTVESEQFKNQLREAGIKPVQTPLFAWYGQANDLLSLILQRSILGVESYVSAAVWLEMGGRLTAEMNEKIRNPFKISRGAGTAMSFYHYLPSLLSASLSLRKQQPNLWQEVDAFYRNIRNPLFHGEQLDTVNPAELTPLLVLIESIYDWIGTWHAGDLAAAKRRFLMLKPGG